MSKTYHRAKFFENNPGGVRCLLCPRLCVLGGGKTGRCGARKNVDNELVSLNYGRVSSIAVDPIEKKPLNRFMPGTHILSLGSFGCNLSCDFCQNYSIAQRTPDTVERAPENIVNQALELKEGNYGNIGIAYTYNEPTVWYEFVFDCAALAGSKGLENVLVTNGYINSEPLEEILPYISAMNIDLKGDGLFYSALCGAPTGTDTEGIIKANIKRAIRSCHVELTTLIVPGWNDDLRFIEAAARWIAAISEEIPYHLSRFFPRNRMQDSQPTDSEFMKNAAAIAGQRLKYVYIGNM